MALRQAFVVERPQVLQGTAAARQDQHVAFGAPAGSFKGRDDLRRRLSALNGHGVDQDRCRGKAPRQHMQNVPHRGAGR